MWVKGCDVGAGCDGSGGVGVEGGVLWFSGVRL